MSHCDTPSATLAGTLSEWDQESFFSAPTNTAPPARTRLPINKRLLAKNRRWGREERGRYVAFLREEFDLVDRPAQERAVLRAYWRMASSVRTRTHAECRIYHGSMLRRWGSTEGAIRACEGDLWGRVGEGKMQQYALRVAAEEEEQGGRMEEEGLWECCSLLPAVTANQSIHYGS